MRQIWSVFSYAAFPKPGPGDAQLFESSLSALKAQYNAELERLVSIFNSVQQSKTAQIDALKSEIAELQTALGIVR